MKAHKYEHLEETETSYIRTWYNNQENNDAIKSIMEKNPIYFSRSMDLCKNKSKIIFSLVILSLCKTKDCKVFFYSYFTKYIETIQDLVVFLDIVKTNRGFGKAIRTAVYNWFRSKTLKQLETEFLSNCGNTSWTNRDILNKFHIKPWNQDVSRFLKIVVEKEKNA